MIWIIRKVSKVNVKRLKIICSNAVIFAFFFLVFFSRHILLILGFSHHFSDFHRWMVLRWEKLWRMLPLDVVCVHRGVGIGTWKEQTWISYKRTCVWSQKNQTTIIWWGHYIQGVFEISASYLGGGCVSSITVPIVNELGGSVSMFMGPVDWEIPTVLGYWQLKEYLSVNNTWMHYQEYFILLFSHAIAFF